MRILPTVIAVLAVAGCSTMSDEPPAVPSSSVTVSPKRVERVRDDIDRLVRSGMTGVIATLTENGQTVTLTAGVSDLTTNAPIPLTPPQQVRIGSVSKTFIASIILQLVTEGRMKLDDSVDTYLPGLLQGDGVDGRNITVRQLLLQRSGLPEATDSAEMDEYGAGVLGRTFTPAEEVAIALRNPGQFAPGERFKYTNTNYIVAAMLVEKVTGRPYSEELQGRITLPNQLTETYLPRTSELDFRGPHPQGYALVDGVRTDVSRQEPSTMWAAGGVISTGDDLNRFFLALLDGRIVADAELREMLATREADDFPMQYGLGVASTELDCGATYVGHEGGVAGFVTLAGATADGRAATLALTGPFDKQPDSTSLLSHALCP